MNTSLIINEGIKNRERYALKPYLTKEQLKSAVQYVIKKTDHNLDVFGAQFPAPASINLIYPVIGNTEWTSSFWTGLLWQVYELTGNPKYHEAIHDHLKSYQERLKHKIAIDTHDLGFLYSLSCVAAYKLTGHPEAKKTAIKAADQLMTRYFEKAGIIQAWGDLNNPEQKGRMIIDCCMNLPLLYWAALMTKHQSYYQAAYNHVQQAGKYLVRPDASTYHTFYMDVETGQPRYGKTCQGFSDDSCWSRGQAWAIYGFTLNYLYTHDPNLIDLTKKVANYFLNRLPDDDVCYWDLVFTSGSEERDSSAAAIACCGLLELIKHLNPEDPDLPFYKNAALSILSSLINHYTSAHEPNASGLLLHSVYAKPEQKGVDECTIWGDYFYAEALVRCVKEWLLYW